jgi:hypothetical protein
MFRLLMSHLQGFYVAYEEPKHMSGFFNVLKNYTVL